MFVVTSILFLGEWVYYCSDLISRWPKLDASLRTDASGLAVFAFALWIFLFREKCSGYAMAMLCFVFGASSQLALHLFLALQK